MKVLSFVFYILAAIVSNQALGAERSCSSIVGELSSFERIVKKIERIAPEVLEGWERPTDDFVALTQLYLLAKRYAWELLPKGHMPWGQATMLSKVQSLRVRRQTNPKYQTTEFDDKEAYLFFVNQLQGLYIYLEQNLKRTLFHRASGNRHLHRILLVTWDKVTFPGLGEPSLSPERAEQILASSVHDIAWDTLIEIFNAASTMPFSEQVSFVQSNEAFSALPEYVQNAMISAMMNAPEVPLRTYCCKDSTGCSFCPNNRSFLNSDSAIDL